MPDAFVKPPFGSQGMARQLVETVVRHSAEHVEIIRASVVIANLAARKLYYDLGFRPFGFDAQALKIDGRYHDEEHLTLSLRPA